MQILITHDFTVRGPDGERLPVEGLHAEGVRLMEELLKLEECNVNIADPATSSDGIRGTVGADLVVTADTEVEALEVSSGIVRTAIHAIGGWTPGWPETDEVRASYAVVGSQLTPA
jgi:hypothetical protein